MGEADTTGDLLTHPGVDEEVEELSTAPLAPFHSRIDRCIYEKADGSVVHTRTNQQGLAKRFVRHLAGQSRLGVFLVLPRDVCRAGVVDLDSHDPAGPTRHNEAVEIVELLDRGGIIAYWVPSRGGRGAHVWVFFDAPGVPAGDLRGLLNKLAAPHEPGVDARPDSSRYGGPIFLPYFGVVADMRDVDAKPVTIDKLDANNPSVIPHTEPAPRASTFVPRYKLGRRRSGPSSAAFHEFVKEGESLGLVFYEGGRPQARDGWRNNIAGCVAGSILARGGRFEDFVAWDSSNDPPLQGSEPGQLERWWRSAEARHSRRLQ